MRLWQGALVSLLMVTGIHSVTITDFPECAQNCISHSAAQLGGSPNDLDFICKSSEFLNSVSSCEAQNCSPSDLNRVFTLAIQICEPVGGTNHIGLFNLSACAQPGLAIATRESGCSTSNWTCVCSSSAYTIVAAEYEEQYCSPADRQAIIDFSSAACAAVGVELVSPAPGSSNTTSLLTSSEPSVYKFPDCARPCVDAALLQSGCGPLDWECICVNPAFVGGALAFCELESCSVADQYNILNYTGAQCSAIGEALIPATTVSPSSSVVTSVVPPLQAAAVPLVFPTGSAPASVPQFSNLPLCAQFCARNATSRNGGSVADLSFLCKSGAVLSAIGACESALCSPTDQLTSFILSGKLCEPVEGVASIDPITNPSAQASLISAAYPTTTAVTNLDTVPPCAKPCLVTAFNQSGCALGDVSCQCTNQAFRPVFNSCQAASCGVLELQRLLPFTYQRCQAVGVNIPASVVSIESEVAYKIPTSTDALPTPTNLADAANDIEKLPFCAQECIYEAASRAGCDIHNLTCICTNAVFSAYVGTCETIACTADELQVIEAYSNPLCAPVPNARTVYPTGASLSSYLAEATYSAPSPPTVTNAPNNISALPICARSCIYSAAAAANCSSINDLTCVCQNAVFLSSVGRCEQASCSGSELEVISATSEKVCALAGGITASFTSNSSSRCQSSLARYYIVASLGWLFGMIYEWV